MRAVELYVRCVADAILDAKQGNTVAVTPADADYVEVPVEKETGEVKEVKE